MGEAAPPYVVYSSKSGGYFADSLASCLGVPREKIERKTFGDGEEYLRLDVNTRTELSGKRVIYVTSTATDSDLIELVRVGGALAGYGTLQRIFVIPFLGYSTMERAVLPGEVVSIKSNIRMLSSIPSTGLGNIFVFLDLHVQGILHYFEGPAIRVELYAERLLSQAVEKLSLSNFVFGSADLGRPKWVETFAFKFNTGIALIRKSRDFEETTVRNVIGDVAGKDVVIYDDMTRSAGTLIQAADAYKAHGAKRIYAVLSHLGLNRPVGAIVDKLTTAPFEKIISTNSHPMSMTDEVQRNDKFLILDAAPVFADYIRELAGCTK